LKLLLIATAAVLLAMVAAFVAADHHVRVALVEVSTSRLAQVRDTASRRVLAYFERTGHLLERLARGSPLLLSPTELADLARQNRLTRMLVVGGGWTVGASSHPRLRTFPSGARLVPRAAQPSLLARCVGEAQRNRRVFFTDLAQHGGNGEVMAFLCAPLPGGGGLAAELDLSHLHKLASFREGAGRGQVYLVGGDLRLRSDFHVKRPSFNVRQTFSGKLRINSGSARAALRGRTGAVFELNAARQQVLAAHAPLRLYDSHWAVVAEAPREEVLEAARALRWYVRIAALLAVLLVAFFLYEGFFGAAFAPLRSGRKTKVAAAKERASVEDNKDAAAGARLLDPAAVVVAVLLAASTLLLPERLLEPDDETFRDTMVLFSSGELVKPLDGSLPKGWAAVPDRKWLMSEKPPGHPLALAALHKLGLQRLINPLWIAACALALLMLGRALHPEPRYRLLLVLLFAVNPTLLLMTYRTYMSDLSGAAAVTCAAALFLVAELRGRRRLYLLAGLLLGVSVVIRYNNIVACLVVPLYLSLAGLLRERSARGLYHWIKGCAPWLVALGAAPPLLAQLCYNWWTTGSPLRVGYSFTLFLSGSPRFGERFFLHNLLDAPPLLLLGFPCLLLFPLGLIKLYQRRRRVAVYCALLVAAFFVFYMVSYWVRADHFVFFTRYCLPALIGLSICAAEALMAFSSRRAAYLTVALLVLLSASLTGDFVKRYVLADTWYIRTGTIESRHTLDDLQDP